MYNFFYFTKIKNFGGNFLKFWALINLPRSHVRSHTKFGPQTIQLFWRLLHTNKYTDTQTDKQSLYKDKASRALLFNFKPFSLWKYSKTKKKFANFIKKTFRRLSNFQKFNFLNIRSSINLPWDHAWSQKMRARLWRLLDTNRQTSKIYI